MTITAASRVTGTAVDRVNREKDDFYPTPPEATRALLSKESFIGPIWEPACGQGHISKVLEENRYEVFSSDLVDRGYGSARIDFLMEWQPRAPNIVTNPPFKMVEEFARQSLAMTTRKVALLLRLACLEGAERGKIYDSSPLARVWVFRRWLSMYRNGEETEGGGMLAFAWFVWDRQHAGAPHLGWLP